MKQNVPRLRMIAGPNGSGKSTIKSLLQPDLLGIYINPDEIRLQIQSNEGVDLAAYGVRAKEEEVRRFFVASTLTKNAALDPLVEKLSVDNPLYCNLCLGADTLGSFPGFAVRCASTSPCQAGESIARESSATKLLLSTGQFANRASLINNVDWPPTIVRVLSIQRYAHVVVDGRGQVVGR